MKYTREQIEAYQKDFKEYAENNYPHRRLNFSIGEEFLEHKFPKKLPEEGLLFAKKNGRQSLVYRTGETSGYGFDQGQYKNRTDWFFVKHPEMWQPATSKQEKKFIEMLKKECEKRGLFKNTKIENHADIKDCDLLNKFSFEVAADTEQLWSRNGQIFYKGKFAKPLKELTPKEELIEMLDKLDPKIINHISKIVIPMFTKK